MPLRCGEMVFVKRAIPSPDFCLYLTFSNSERRHFDVSPYLDKGVFRQLQDYALFSQVRVVAGTVEWPGEIDLCPDTLYEKSEPLQNEHHP